MGRFSKFMIALLTVSALAYYWLLVNAGPDGVPARDIDLAAVRQAAEVMPGEKPTGITFAPIALRRMPSAMLAAGTGLRYITSGVISWRIETPKGGIVIDPGLSEEDAQSMGFERFDPAARQLVDQWMDQAELIVFTHAHVDHVGGFLDHPDFKSIVAKAVVSDGMIGSMNALWRENARLLNNPRTLKPIQAVAPGVVLIETPGHTPESEMIFVRLASGREYLFAGDVVSLEANAKLWTPHSRLVSDWLQPEDRSAVIGWLKGIESLKQQAPRLTIVPSHDADWLIAHAKQTGVAAAPQLVELRPSD